MESFLWKSAAKIISQHGKSIDEISIILPSKRATIYLQKELATLLNAPYISPNIITINEWIDDHTPFKIINQTEQLFLLYEVHRQIEKTVADDFSTFLKWGKIILSDFDEIDRNLIEPKDIFRDLKSIEDIENWSFSEEELSPSQESYSRLWGKLPAYYEQFNQLLDKHHLTYQGKAYKQFVEAIDSIEKTSSHYYFIGFNAFSKSEMEIVKFLLRAKKVELIFDYDSFYIDNPVHEAGLFYRKIKSELNIPIKIEKQILRGAKQFEMVETSSQIAQVHVAATVLGKLANENGKLNNTAIVLADESLLAPLLRSLPPEIESANISMGYPIRFSHLQSLVDLVFEIQFNFIRFKNDRLYYKSVLNLIAHPYFKELYFGETRLQEFAQSVNQRNQIFIEREEIFSEFPELKTISLIFDLWEDYRTDGFLSFHQITAVLYKEMNETEASFGIDLEILYHFHTGIQRFEDITVKYDHLLDLKSFKRLFFQFWQSESLSFLGNPIDGLQIIGVLESRALDFENLIVLGMNEGNLPKTRMDSSLIPYDLKRSYQLPTEEHREAIFAHHFYRLLHCANNIWFTYNSSSDNLTSGEKSRYLIQLQHELNLSSGHQFKTFTYAFEEETSTTSLATYGMNDLIREKLSLYFERGFSPSALNKLVRCPLDFYYTYILDLKEIEKVEENVEASTFGTKIHDVLEEVFKELFVETGKPLSVAAIKSTKGELSDRLKKKYLEDFSESDFKYGQNKLRFDVSVRYLEEFMKRQIAEIESQEESINIVKLEENLFAEYDWTINGESKKICLNGKADRIDRIGDHYRIIDYKSGKCGEDQVTFKIDDSNGNGIQDFMNDSRKSYARQLLMYALMFRQQYPTVKEFSVGIISMVNLRDWIQNVRIAKSEDLIIDHEILDAFEEELRQKLEEILSDDFKFSHDSKSEYCDYCET
ncbi:PD-(D/E)XK nuclease family protein [Crocinitomix catalasitica]|nr:PD-(D/E)XK nuclease family protein [Crocinitomix catalasitica]